MDFNLPPGIEALAASVRDFVKREIVPFESGVCGGVGRGG